MSHYQKLVALALRLAAVIVIAVGVVGVGYVIVTDADTIAERNERLLFSFGLITVGCLGFAVSPALGRLVGKDL